jgi:biotin carboxyl carrier protein
VIRFEEPAAERDEAPDGDGVVRAPMSGKLVSVAVVVGQRVERGEVVAVLEAMKLQSPLEAGVSGEVVAVPARVDDQVSGGSVVVRIEPD